jgi:NAD(P)-dependent dehydrogenase (short-subunit alcohol dehydrogenase family)
MSFAGKLVGALRFPGVAYSFSRLGYRRRARRWSDRPAEDALAGKTCLVTGGNAGLGFAAAAALAGMGAHVDLLCRSRERGAAAAAELAQLGAGSIGLEVVDLGDNESIDQLLARLAHPAIDVLIHNAGALLDRRVDTRDGLETTLAVHVVGPQRLTRGLLPRLKAAPAPRVIYVSSGGMYSERLSVAELLAPPTPFQGVRAYARAKRAQVALVEMWAAREPAIGFYAMHPGWADTEGVRTSLPGFYRATRRWLRSPAEGADTAVWLAASATLPMPSGAFVFDRRPAPRHIVPGTRADAAEHERLWSEVERLAQAPSGGSADQPADQPAQDVDHQQRE